MKKYCDLESLFNKGLSSGIIVANSPLPPRDLCHRLLRGTDRVICADGGANRLHGIRDERDDEILPTFIVGDLDSIRDDVKTYYESRGVPVVFSHCQNTTDLDKAMMQLKDLVQSGIVLILGIVGSHGGRIDQLFATINTACRFSALFDIVSIGEESLLIVLPPGDYEFILPDACINNHCGLVPLLGRVDSVTTDGLEWNLSNSLLEFGELISTNNLIRNKKIQIKNSNFILFTITYI